MQLSNTQRIYCGRLRASDGPAEAPQRRPALAFLTVRSSARPNRSPKGHDPPSSATQRGAGPRILLALLQILVVAFPGARKGIRGAQETLTPYCVA